MDNENMNPQPGFTPVPTPQNSYVPPRTTQRFCPVTDTRDIFLASMLLIFCIMLVDTLFWSTAGLFVSISMGMIAIFSFLYLWKYRKKVTIYSLFCVFATLLLDASFTFHDDTWVKFCTFVMCVVLLSSCFLDLTQVRRHIAGTIYAIGDFFWLIFPMTFGRIGRGLYALFHKQEEDGSFRTRRIGAVLLGLVIALPLVCIILPLLSSSDAAFEALMGKIRMANILHFIIAALFGLFLAVLLFGQLYCLGRTKRQQKETAGKRGIEPVVVVSFLSVLCLIYAIYVVSQLAYFFDAFRGLLPKDYTVAKYARRGFAEMCVLCVINLCAIIFSLMLCRRKDDNPPRGVRLPALLLCLFSVLLVAVSMSKMLLYIQSFGMTRLRILTSGFMLVLDVLFICVGLWLFIKKFPYLKFAVAAAAIVLLAFSFGNVDRFVARYNVHAYQSGKLDSIDVETLGDLSSASVPYLVELLDDSDPAVAKQAKRELHDDLAEFYFYEGFDSDNEESVYAGERHYDIRGFNLDTYRARTLLRDNFDRVNPLKSDDFTD
ncbi:MAG: DUF4173 domain-containing protein [Clostridia bacterium]|nr:DUF4173 domain-containing protein [Clostridia bacterium]